MATHLVYTEAGTQEWVTDEELEDAAEFYDRLVAAAAATGGDDA